MERTGKQGKGVSKGRGGRRRRDVGGDTQAHQVWNQKNSAENEIDPGTWQGVGTEGLAGVPADNKSYLGGGPQLGLAEQKVDITAHGVGAVIRWSIQFEGIEGIRLKVGPKIALGGPDGRIGRIEPGQRVCQRG